MLFLNQQYLETRYRYFGNLVSKFLIGYLNKSNSELKINISDKKTQEWPFNIEELWWTIICTWARNFIIAIDVTTDWAKDWFNQGIATIPQQIKCDWKTRDDAFLGWLKLEYIEYLEKRFRTRDIDSETWEEFWQQLWLTYLDQRGLEPVSVSKNVQNIIHKFVESHAQDTFMWDVSDLVRECCNADNIQWANVSQPHWAIAPPLQYWTDETNHGWDTPYIILAKILSCEVDDEDMQRYIEDQGAKMIERLKKALENSLKDYWSFDFSFPIENHHLPPGVEVDVHEKVKIVGITEERVKRLLESGGIRPLPELNAGDAHFVVSIHAPLFNAAYQEALTIVGNLQALLRVADNLSRWELSKVFFYSGTDLTGKLSDIGEKPIHVQRRDNYQLPRFLDYEKVLHFRDLIAWLEHDERELAKALLIAMRWQGISRTQDGSENEYLCLWIALEKLGNGSYNYRKVVPKVAGTLWHLSLLSNVPKATARKGIEQARDIMGSLVGNLAKIRNREVAHRGEFRGKRDTIYATLVLRNLVNDLTEWLLHVLQNSDVKSFNELLSLMDSITDSTGLIRN